MNNNFKFQLVVEADTNDADYITKLTDVSLETVEELRPLFNAILKNDGEWITSAYQKYIMKDGPYKMYGKDIEVSLIDKFKSMVPYGEHGVHSIETIKLIQYCDVETFI